MGEGGREWRGRQHTLIPGMFSFSLSSHYFKCCYAVMSLPLSAAGFNTHLVFILLGLEWIRVCVLALFCSFTLEVSETTS